MECSRRARLNKALTVELSHDTGLQVIVQQPKIEFSADSLCWEIIKKTNSSFGGAFGNSSFNFGGGGFGSTFGMQQYMPRIASRGRRGGSTMLSVQQEDDDDDVGARRSIGLAALGAGADEKKDEN